MSKPSEPRIYKVAEWKGRHISRPFPLSKAAGIVIHHAVFPNRPPLAGDRELAKAFQCAQTIQRQHIDDNGWADSGQHFTVSRGGIILEARSGSADAARAGQIPKGAHASVDTINRTYFGIELEGTYHIEDVVTEAQWTALAQLCAWLAWKGNFDTANIHPHCRYKSTLCPGKVQARLPDLRKRAHDGKLEYLNFHR